MSASKMKKKEITGKTLSDIKNHYSQGYSIATISYITKESQADIIAIITPVSKYKHLSIVKWI